MQPEPASGAASVPAIVLTRVSKSFGPAPAVRDLSLQIRKGEFVSLVGGSGSGKTTTLKMINRLVEPDRGEIEIFGERTDTLRGHELRRRIGYVFQGVGLFPHMSVAENVAVTPKLLGWPRAEIDARVAELLDLVELPAAEYADRAPSMLSGGQRQRVGFARAIAARASLVLMDEPFGALDPVTRTSLGEAYLRLHRSLGLTTIMVTHDMTEAVLFADRIGVMHRGELIAFGRPSVLLRSTDERVRLLLDAPRLQAERLQARLGGETADG